MMIMKKKTKYCQFCEEPSNQNLSRVFTKPSTPVTTIAGSSTLSNVNNNNNNNITSSPHRSVSEELLDHLTYDLRIMQMSDVTKK